MAAREIPVWDNLKVIRSSRVGVIFFFLAGGFHPTTYIILRPLHRVTVSFWIEKKRVSVVLSLSLSMLIVIDSQSTEADLETAIIIDQPVPNSVKRRSSPLSTTLNSTVGES